MDLGLLLLTLTALWKSTSAVLTCYTCGPEYKEFDPGAPLCDHFNTSDPKFYKACPYSTFCYKKISYSERGSLVTTSIERGCTPQTWEGEQVKEKHHWKAVKNIYDQGYSEGCNQDPINTLRSVKTTSCYCRGDHCNGSWKHSANSLFVLGITAIVIRW